MAHACGESWFLTSRIGPGGMAALLLLAVLAAPVWAKSSPGSADKPAVDVNLVSAAELEQVRGIGPALAARIVAARDSGGKFRDADELRRRVRGIGETNLRRMVASGLVLSGPSLVAPTSAASRERVELLVGNIPAKSEARSGGRVEEIACCGRDAGGGGPSGSSKPDTSREASDAAPPVKSKR